MGVTYFVDLKIPDLSDVEIQGKLAELEIEGLQELPLGEAKGLFRVDKNYEILEFESKTSKEYLEYLSTHEAKGPKVYRLFVREDISDQLEKLFPKAKIGKLSEVKALDYEDEYKKSFRGKNMGKNLWVGPPWSKPDAGRTAFFVEPGMAFGTGDHPTTELCLERIEELAGKFQPKKILDLGSGTGILSLVAAHFFPEATIYSLDIDPECEAEHKKLLGMNSVPSERIHGLFGAEGDVAAA